MQKRQHASTSAKLAESDFRGSPGKNHNKKHEVVPADLEQRIVEADRNPLTATSDTRARIVRSKSDYDAALLYDVVVAYAAALRLAKHSLHWGCFVNHPFWKTFDGHLPKRSGERKHLKWVMLFVFGVSDKRGKARANTYTVALRKLFRNKAEPRSVVAYVRKHGGIEKLYEANRTPKPKTEVTKTDPSATDIPNLKPSEQQHPAAQNASDDIDNTAEAPSVRSAPNTAVEHEKKPTNDEAKKEKKYLYDLNRQMKSIEASDMRALIVKIDNETLLRLNDKGGPLRETLELSIVRHPDWVQFKGRLRRLNE